MIATRFDKARAEHYLDCISNGKDIRAPASGWTQFEMLALVGATHFAAFSHGAPLTPIAKVKQMHGEHRELVEEQWSRDLHAAIGWYSYMTMLVVDDQFDNRFEPIVEALVTEDDDGNKTMSPQRGFKNENSYPQK